MNNLNDNANELSSAPTNVVVLRGTVRGEPIERALPSGSVVIQFDVATEIVDGAGSSTVSVPVAWTDPSQAAITSLAEAGNVVVIGTIRRRFFRVGGATQSRTEVVAEVVLPARRRSQVTRAINRLAEQLAC